ncbi:MAG: hypothetical protein K2X00_17400 [Nitrospiraceae bacterium]|jgi:hypothetical protein|nr:hypothetical protein [Nitrospiraceae bacterium]MCS6284463.1 hypothetical protein [Nitrospira sp.]OQW67020.1 MAG: hypothetical protein BVN29_05150 [Nitrospira sp. ST-bin5]
MTCERCNGLMVREQICDLQGRSSSLCVDGYRCLLCGDLVDAMILDNRQRSLNGVETFNRTRPRIPQVVTA